MLQLNVKGVLVKQSLNGLQTSFACDKLMVDILESAIIELFQWAPHSFEQYCKLVHLCAHRLMHEGFYYNGFKPTIFAPHITILECWCKLGAAWECKQQWGIIWDPLSYIFYMGKFKYYVPFQVCKCSIDSWPYHFSIAALTWPWVAGAIASHFHKLTLSEAISKVFNVCILNFIPSYLVMCEELHWSLRGHTMRPLSSGLVF